MKDKLIVKRNLATYIWYGGEYVDVISNKTGQVADVLNVAHLARNHNNNFNLIEDDEVVAEIDNHSTNAHDWLGGE